MAGFPLFIEMTGRKILVIGGGKVALRKIRVLLDFGADIQVVCASPCPEITGFEKEGKLHVKPENFDENKLQMIDDSFMLICASDDRRINHAAAAYAKDRNVWVNCADDPDISSCIFPSVVRREDIVIGISSSGQVPALTRHLRKKIERAVPEDYAELEKELLEKRQLLIASDLPEKEKKEQLYRMIDEAERRMKE